MTTPFSFPKKIDQLTNFLSMEILQEAQKLTRAGHDVISLSIGEPDFKAPEVVKEATVRAIQKDFTRYTHSQGLLELREAICEHYRDRYHVHIEPEQIIVTSGTSPAMLLAFGALLDIGDEVIMTDPHYPCYSNFIEFLNGKVVYVPVLEEDAFQYRPEEVRKKINKKTKAIFINSPSNPTGCTLSGDIMKELVGMGPVIVSDEIYHGLTYEGEERTILEFTDRAFVLNGFSKAYAMTGFRLGYLIAPKEFIPALGKLQQNFFISTSSFIQEAGIVALKETTKEREAMRSSLNERRKLMIEGVRNLGFKIAREPTAAFYVFANAQHYTKDSFRFAMDILQSVHVGISPGIDFGIQGEGFMRFSYANKTERIVEGLRRIGEYLKK